MPNPKTYAELGTAPSPEAFLWLFSGEIESRESVD
jgi:hypothetical protein